MRVEAPIKVDRKTKKLAKRLSTGDIAVINHTDIDEVAANSLVECKIKLVINAAPSISGRYPNKGPKILIDNNILIIDNVGEANISQDVPLGSNGPSNGITLGTQNKLTIPTDGVYKVDYYFSGSSNVNADVTLNVKQNATPIGSTTISKNVTANVDSDFVGSTINAFSANDQIGLSLESTTAVTISPASDTSAYLNIVKIA